MSSMQTWARPMQTVVVPTTKESKNAMSAFVTLVPLLAARAMEAMAVTTGTKRIVLMTTHTACGFGSARSCRATASAPSPPFLVGRVVVGKVVLCEGDRRHRQFPCGSIRPR